VKDIRKNVVTRESSCIFRFLSENEGEKEDKGSKENLLLVDTDLLRLGTP